MSLLLWCKRSALSPKITVQKQNTRSFCSNHPLSSYQHQIKNNTHGKEQRKVFKQYFEEKQRRTTEGRTAQTVTLAEDAIESIQSLKKQNPETTNLELAKRFNVDVATVRKALRHNLAVEDDEEENALDHTIQLPRSVAELHPATVLDKLNSGITKVAYFGKRLNEKPHNKEVQAALMEAAKEILNLATIFNPHEFRARNKSQQISHDNKDENK